MFQLNGQFPRTPLQPLNAISFQRTTFTDGLARFPSRCWFVDRFILPFVVREHPLCDHENRYAVTMMIKNVFIMYMYNVQDHISVCFVPAVPMPVPVRCLDMDFNITN